MAGHAESVAPLVVRVVVPCPCDRAFDYFTQDIGTGWPLATHSVGRADAARCAFEPRIGGRLVETTRHGAEHVWGTVTAWDPPRRIAFTWHPGRGPETAQSVDVSFIANPEGTEVTLIHAGFASLGDRGPAMRTEYGSGWQAVLRERFTAHVYAGEMR